MLRLDEQVARCFQRLQAKEFEPLVAFLKESREGTLEQLVGAVQQEHIFRLQGEAGVLADLLGHVKNSNELVTKLSATRKG